jgi:hypothetical protein
LEVDLRPTNVDGDKVYEYYYPDFQLRVYADHGMVSDQDLNFEDYPYALSLWRLSGPDHVRSDKNTLEFAWLAFTKLKGTACYRLLFVENLEKKLASFDSHL